MQVRAATLVKVTELLHVRGLAEDDHFPSVKAARVT